MGDRGDKHFGRCSTHRDSPILAGKSGFRKQEVGAVVERKDVDTAGKQTVVRKEEQLNARQAEFRKGRQGRVVLRKSVVDGVVHWRLSIQWLQTVDVFFHSHLLDCLPLTRAGQRQEKASASQIEGNHGPITSRCN